MLQEAYAAGELKKATLGPLLWRACQITMQAHIKGLIKEQ